MSITKKTMIVGAGAAGLACALSAAAQGADVYLLEKTARLGGTVAHSLIHTIGGLYDDAGEYINDGLPVELAELLLQANPQTCKRKMGKVWTLSVDPATYEKVVCDWVISKSNISVMCGAYVKQIQMEGGRICQVEVTHAHETKQINVDALVDATGSAAVVRLIDPNRVVDGDALAGLIFQIRGVTPNALKFPKNVGIQRQIQQAVKNHVLPPVFSRTWFDTGVYVDEVYAKLNIVTTALDINSIQDWQEQLLHFLKQLPEFSGAQVTQVGRLGIRDGGRIKGNYCLTVEDIKAGRSFADSVGRCAWPIEYWDPQQGVTLDYLPPNHTYEIPLRSLQVSDMENLWAAGKCLSAEKLAQASARVVGTCWAMGDALGKVITSHA